MNKFEKDSLYEAYTETKHWKACRSIALYRAGSRCQLCGLLGESGLEVHHNSYENITAEQENDLFVLCHECHTLFHHRASLNGTHLREIDFDHLKRFVEEETGIQLVQHWYLCRHGNRLGVSKYFEKTTISETMIPNGVVDKLLASFNCLSLRSRANIEAGGWESYIGMWLAKEE